MQAQFNFQGRLTRAARNLLNLAVVLIVIGTLTLGVLKMDWSGVQSPLDFLFALFISELNLLGIHEQPATLLDDTLRLVAAIVARFMWWLYYFWSHMGNP